MKESTKKVVRNSALLVGNIAGSYALSFVGVAGMAHGLAAIVNVAKGVTTTKKVRTVLGGGLRLAGGLGIIVGSEALAQYNIEFFGNQLTDSITEMEGEAAGLAAATRKPLNLEAEAAKLDENYLAMVGAFGADTADKIYAVKRQIAAGELSAADGAEQISKVLMADSGFDDAETEEPEAKEPEVDEPKPEEPKPEELKEEKPQEPNKAPKERKPKTVLKPKPADFDPTAPEVAPA